MQCISSEVRWLAVGWWSMVIKRRTAMRKRHLLIAAAMGGLAVGWVGAKVELSEGVKLKAGNEAIDDKKLGHFVPTVADWNGDGKKDLIVGSFTGEPGNVRLFLNVGTDAEPKFDKAVFMEAGGVPIKLTGG